jgi:competence protein ComEA
MIHNTPSPASSLQSPDLININTATEEALTRLPRIGPVLARRITAYRRERGPFKTIDDLKNVPGIGHATFEAIKGLIVVE